ncbi:hypothetical protein VdG2_07302 [Verticillium dahliae VDG2]|nr:hypothetical protein VdG2_07302 [Verticillium dahliae VDG2]
MPPSSGSTSRSLIAPPRPPASGQASTPRIRPTAPGSDVYAWTQSSRQDAVFRLPATFPTASVGGAVEGYLEAGPTTLGIVAVVITDNLNMTDVVKVWQVVPGQEVPGQEGVCLDVSEHTSASGTLLARNLPQPRWSEQFPERHQLFPGDTMT